MEENNTNVFYLNIGGDKVFIKEDENKTARLLEEEYLKRKKEEKKKGHYGVVNVNGILLTYSYKIILSGNTYYINTELANGRNKSRILDLSGGYYRNKEKTINDYCDMISRACFSYKIITYGNGINVMYVFNDKYKNMFEDNNKYEDLD